MSEADLLPPGSIQLVADASGLQRLVEAARAAGRVALDSEFHAERRYLPELMLLQVATDASHAWIVDPLAVDPRPLGAALEGADLLVHGGQMDLRLVEQHLGVRPRKIFDTQCGAALLGMRFPERLGTLGQQVLGWTMDKGATLSDWSHRPLGQKQLRYAATDVLALFALTDALEQRLEARGRRELAWQASTEILHGSLAALDPEEEARGWEIAQRLDVEARKALVALLAWREEAAQRRNQPAHYLLPNGILLDLARRRPDSSRALMENRRIHPGFIKHNGAEVLEVLRAARDWPAPASPPTPQQQRLARAILLWAELVGEAEEISPAILMPDGLALRLAAEGTDILEGTWRAWLAPLAKKFFSGETSIRVRAADGQVRLEQDVGQGRRE